MNEMIDTTTQTPIEIALQIDDEGMTTARKLYEFLELAPRNYARWCKVNITDNEFATENEDYWAFFLNEEWGGQATTDYKLTAHFAKKLSVKGNSAKAEQAREYFTRVEERAKQIAIDRSQLSSSTRALYGLIDGIAKVELEQKRQAEQLKQIQDKQDVLVDTFKKTDGTEDFQRWANDRIAQIAESPNYAIGHSRQEKYKIARGESYNRLKKKRNCRLEERVQKAIGRALSERPDIKKSELQKINTMYVIANDKDLKLAYEMVIKEMMMCYCTK
jgi:anti-repressor protein